MFFLPTVCSLYPSSHEDFDRFYIVYSLTKTKDKSNMLFKTTAATSFPLRIFTLLLTFCRTYAWSMTNPQSGIVEWMSEPMNHIIKWSINETLQKRRSRISTLVVLQAPVSSPNYRAVFMQLKIMLSLPSLYKLCLWSVLGILHVFQVVFSPARNDYVCPRDE